MCPWSYSLIILAVVLSTTDSLNITMTADNYIRELYFDGTSIPISHGGWGDAWTFVLPANLSVIAVKCEDTEDYGGYIASTTDDSILTDASWKCTTVFSANWYTPNFDDSQWPAAVIAAANGADVHGLRPGISTNASWIWTVDNGYQNQSVFDPIVYCRSRNYQLPSTTTAATIESSPAETTSSVTSTTTAKELGANELATIIGSSLGVYVFLLFIVGYFIITIFCF